MKKLKRAMMKNKKLLIGILIMGGVLIGEWWVWNGQMLYSQAQEITITTNKTEYEQGETVEITIKNNLDIPLRSRFPLKDPKFYNQTVGWGIIERFEDDNWLGVEPIWRCGCFDLFRQMGFFILKANESRCFEWDQTRLLCDARYGRTIGSEPVSSGRYRVSSTFWDENKELDTQRTFYSNEFIIKSDVIITIKRGPCYRICPVYSLTIYENGTIVYEGNKFVRVTGKQVSKISQEKVKELIDEFYRINYFSLKDSYEEHIITDMETVITSITINGKTKTVRYYHGDRNAPKELSALEDKIDETVNSHQWIK